MTNTKVDLLALRQNQWDFDAALAMYQQARQCAAHAILAGYCLLYLKACTNDMTAYHAEMISLSSR